MSNPVIPEHRPMTYTQLEDVYMIANAKLAASEARNRELTALLDTERAVATELRKALEGFSTTCDQLREQRDKLLEALRKLEWESRDEDGYPYCPSCFQSSIHADGCIIDAALKATALPATQNEESEK